MPKGYVRKRCRDCKRTSPGRVDRPEWCDRCRGEMIAVPYGTKRRRRVGR